MELLQWKMVCKIGDDEVHRPPLVALRVTSDKDQKMPELEQIDFLHTQPSEAY